MSKYAYPKYDWLPDELKQTGINKHKNERHYEGAGAVLTAGDNCNWPPEDAKNYIIWDPEQLADRSADILDAHTTVLMRKLVDRTGFPTKLDFFNWLWASKVDEYASKLNPSPKTFLKKLTEESGVEGVKIFFLAHWLHDMTTEKELLEERRISEKTKSELSPETIETFGFLLDSDFPNLDPILLQGYNDQQELIYLADKRTHPFLSPFFVDAGLSEETRTKLIENPLLELRLKLWWGWTDALFPCMEVMIRKHLSFLENEKYIRLIHGECELTEFGRERLKKGGLLDQLKKFDFALKGAASGGVSFMMPQIIDWGNRFLH